MRRLHQRRRPLHECTSQLVLRAVHLLTQRYGRRKTVSACDDRAAASRGCVFKRQKKRPFQTFSYATRDVRFAALELLGSVSGGATQSR